MWLLDGFMTQAMAVGYDPAEGPIVLGMAAVYPWDTQVEITPESTALYLVMHWLGIDWTKVLDPVALGFSQPPSDPNAYARVVIERVQQAVLSHPDFPQLVRELDQLIRSKRSFVDFLADGTSTLGGGSAPLNAPSPPIQGLVEGIVYDLFSGSSSPQITLARSAQRLFNIATAQDGSFLFNLFDGGISAEFDRSGKLVVKNYLPVPIAVGALTYEAEVDSGQYATALERDVIDVAFSSVPQAELQLGSGRFLACALAGYGGPWLPGPDFPLQDLFHRLQESLFDEVAFLSLERAVGLIPLFGKVAKVPKVVDAAGQVIGWGKTFYDILHEGIDPAAVAQLAKNLLDGIDVNEETVRDRIAALALEVDEIDREATLLQAAIDSAATSSWTADGALWKSNQMMVKYGPDLERFFAGLAESGQIVLNKNAYSYTYNGQRLKVLHPDLGELKTRDAFVKFYQLRRKALLSQKALLMSSIYELSQSLARRQAAKNLLELLPLIDYADFTLWAAAQLSPEHYVCFDVNSGTRTIRRTTVPNLLVTPTEISNGERDVPYTFQVKVLHILRAGGRDNLTLAWNFGDGTAGQRSFTATRSPHEETLTHAYSAPGAYGALFQVASVSGRASQVVPVYIELPKNENNYTLNVCDVWRAANSGGYGITEDLWDISVIRPPAGQKAVFDISFDTYSIPDRIFVYYPPGNLILDTGWRGSSYYDGDPLYPGGIAGPGRGQFDEIFVKGSVDQFKVVVVGPDQGTAWDYSVRCRFVQDSAQTQGVGGAFGPREVPPDPEAVPQFPGRGEGR